ISETAEIGMAVGAALAGLRPVVELYMAEFMLVAMDQVVNEANRFRYMSGGQVKVPLVLKAGYGFTAGWAGQHTGTLTSLFMGVPGLKVVVPFGKAEIRHAGGDVTVVATGWMVPRAVAAAQQLAKEGIKAEVIDPRTVAPLDLDTILKSVDKTGRVVLVDQATPHAAVGNIIAAEIAQHRFNSLKGPIIQVTGANTTIPYSEPLEAYVIPDEARIAAGIRNVLK